MTGTRVQGPLVHIFYFFFPGVSSRNGNTLSTSFRNGRRKRKTFCLTSNTSRACFTSLEWEETWVKRKRLSFAWYVFKACNQLFSENRLRPQERRNRFCHRSPDQSPLQNFRTQIFSRPQDLVFPHSISHKNRKSGTFQFSSGQPGAST